MTRCGRNGKDALPTHDQVSSIRYQMSNCRVLAHKDVACFLFVIAGLIFSLSFLGMASNEYVRVIKGNVNIRTEPSTRSLTVGSAKEGDTFELVGEEGKWYEIDLFSGGRRFLHKSLARPVSYRPEVPEDVAIRRQVFREWNEAGKRAKSDADRKYPPGKALDRNLAYEQLLRDRYRLELLQESGIQPPAFRRILIEGYQKGW